MLEHLVQSHMGGYYISDGDPDFIEEYCETCGDHDFILSSWIFNEENARLNALLRYFMKDVINGKEELDKKIEEYNDYCENKEDIIPGIMDEIRFNSEDVCNIVDALFEDHNINADEYYKIKEISNFEEERQIKMVNHFASTYFSKEKDGRVKVLKLTKK